MAVVGIVQMSNDPPSQFLAVIVNVSHQVHSYTWIVSRCCVRRLHLRRYHRDVSSSSRRLRRKATGNRICGP
jgi:hypothetical protein